MFGIFNRTKVKPNTPDFFELAKVEGSFAIVKQTNYGTQLISSYTRKADAIRGAKRKGIELANV